MRLALRVAAYLLGVFYFYENSAKAGAVGGCGGLAPLAQPVGRLFGSGKRATLSGGGAPMPTSRVRLPPLECSQDLHAVELSAHPVVAQVAIVLLDHHNAGACEHGDLECVHPAHDEFANGRMP